MSEHLYDEHFEVTRDKTIIGAVTRGVTIRSHGRLTVTGAVGGLLIVEPQGTLNVVGALDVERDTSNEGEIAVTGIINGELAPLVADGGRLLLAAGSLIENSDGTQMLQPNGTLGPVPDDGGEKTVINVGRFCVYDAATGQFRI